MKLEAGKAKYPIPDHDRIEFALLQDGEYQRFLIVFHGVDMSPENVPVGCPKHCSVGKKHIEFWPVPDKDYTVRVRYLPPAQEI